MSRHELNTKAKIKRNAMNNQQKKKPKQKHEIFNISTFMNGLVEGRDNQRRNERSKVGWKE